MSKQRQQASTSYPMTFRMVSASDGVTGMTGLSPTVQISKNAAGLGAAAGAVSEIGGGLYALAGNATDRNALGELWLVPASTATAIGEAVLYEIVVKDPFAEVAPTNFSSLSIDGSGRVDIGKVAGTAQTAKDLGANATQTGDSYALANGASGFAAIKTDTAAIKTDVEAGSTGLAAIYNRIGAPVGASVSADIAAIPTTAAPTANANADALLDRVNGVESGVTPRQALRAIAAEAAGISTMPAPGSPGAATIAAIGNSGTPRLAATLDMNGARTTVTPTLT